MNQRINYPRRYALSLMVPFFLFVVGTLVGIFLDDLSFIDSLYFSVITMSTVGFGDLTPTNAVGKVAAVLYLPLAVSALADAISDAGLIKLRRRIRETDYAADADVLLMREAARENDAHETLTEAEFLISVLLEHEIVDETTLSAIRQQFRHICRRSPDADPLLDAKLVFEELVHTGQVLQTRGRHSIMNNGGGDNGGAAANDSPSKVAADAVKDAVAAAAVKEIENADGHHFKGHDGTMGRVSETQRLLHGPRLLLTPLLLPLHRMVVGGEGCASRRSHRRRRRLRRVVRQPLGAKGGGTRRPPQQGTAHAPLKLTRRPATTRPRRARC